MLGLITTPFLSMDLEILKVERTEATMTHNKEFAMCAPGQILLVRRSHSRNIREKSDAKEAHRRPKPNAREVGSRTERSG
jgi:hypothetical protein